MKKYPRICSIPPMFAIMLLAVGALVAAEGAADLKCPTCNMAADPSHSADYDGGKVIFCSAACADEFKKDSAKYAGKAHLQMVKSGQLVQKACPLTGRPMKAESSVNVAGVNVVFCCNNCKGKVEKAQGNEQIDLVFKDVSKGYKPAEQK